MLMSLKQHIGKVCASHPELNGLRTSSRHCVECARERSRQWATANPERQSERVRKWAAANLECKRESARKYRAAHPEHVRKYRAANIERKREYDRNVRAANPERERERLRKYRAANPERARERSRKYKVANPDKVAADDVKRRTAKRQVTPKWANPVAIRKLYSWAARKTRETGTPWHVDHVVPLLSKYVCGLHCEANLRVMSGDENLSKGNRYWPDMTEYAAGFYQCI
jgi:hypothetical protein